ncbi:MAG: CsiV family protein [Pseudohongiellaceae bacterium]
MHKRPVTNNSALTCLPNKLAAGLLLLGVCQSGLGQESWYRVELSVFSNEDRSYRAQEQWLPGRSRLDHPERIVRLAEFTDLLILDSMLPDPLPEEIEASEQTATSAATESNASPREPDPPSPAELRKEAIEKVGPFPPKSGPTFKFFDPVRDSFLVQAASQGDFAQTNRALTRSADHRLLFHAVWQQPVVGMDQATSVFIEGGDFFGNQPELQGNLTIRFNDSEDRVVLDADLWLTEFVEQAVEAQFTANSPAAGIAPNQQEAMGSAEDQELQHTKWVLPKIPNSLPQGPLQILRERTERAETSYVPENVFHMQQSRPMRSNEFHYLDHPALGIVVLVQPYEIPPLPVLEPNDPISITDQPSN